MTDQGGPAQPERPQSGVPAHPGQPQPGGPQHPGQPPQWQPAPGQPSWGYPPQGYPQPGYPQQGGQWGPAPQGYPPAQDARQPGGFPASPGAPFNSGYHGFGAFEGKPAKPKRSRKPWIAGAIVVVVLAGAGVGAWSSGLFDGPVLDRDSVQNGVQSVLRDDFGESDVRNVSCPDDRPVRTGTTFECTATVAGQAKKVTVRVLNEQAQFEVGAPK